jgi:hypothetical protein
MEGGHVLKVKGGAKMWDDMIRIRHEKKGVEKMWWERKKLMMEFSEVHRNISSLHEMRKMLKWWKKDFAHRRNNRGRKGRRVK